MFLKDFYDNLVEIELKNDFFCEKLAITVCDLNQIMAQKSTSGMILEVLWGHVISKILSEIEEWEEVHYCHAAYISHLLSPADD